MTTKWNVECWQCDGDGFSCDCIDGMCRDAEIGCDLCERRCDLCQGKGFYVVTRLTDDNYDRAVPID